MRFLYALFLLWLMPAWAQDVLTNESIEKMAKSGLGESLIVTMVQGQPGKYLLSPDELIKLKHAGVSEKILAAMASKVSKPVAADAGSGATIASATDSDIPQGVEVGVYYKKGDKWEEMLPEVVNWKTGGVLKHVATGGIVKGDINGNIQGGHSRNSLKSPVEVLIYAREGAAITEYQLIHLREKPDYREFRTVTGGVLHTSGGSTRDLVPFEGKKIANRMYKVLLPNLGAGEYGLLPPEGIAMSQGASIGKMYTFRLIE